MPEHDPATHFDDEYNFRCGTKEFGRSAASTLPRSNQRPRSVGTQSRQPRVDVQQTAASGHNGPIWELVGDHRCLAAENVAESAGGLLGWGPGSDSPSRLSSRYSQHRAVCGSLRQFWSCPTATAMVLTMMTDGELYVATNETARNPDWSAGQPRRGSDPKPDRRRPCAAPR